MKTLKTESIKPGLYLVGTPIGNLRDISIRALAVLGSSDLVLCEDTRVTGKLFQQYDINTKKMSYNDHNASDKRKHILEMLANGQTVSLVSDAGLPLISDPGYKLVRDCLDLGLFVTTVPGASSVLSALQLSGLPSDKFSFLGFLPSKEQARKQILSQWSSVPATLIAFETGPRLLSSLTDIEKTLGNRQVSVIREITKIYEQVQKASVSELILRYRDNGPPKGEIVVVIAPPDKTVPDQQQLDSMILSALKDKSVKDVASEISEITGVTKKMIYQRALELQNND
jgi:16S rRNA (cytidine1402-2'-O)-methyltransferase